MALIQIAAIICAIVSIILIIAMYGKLYSDTSLLATPQFESVIGTVLIGSIVLSVLTYLASVQYTNSQVYIPFIFTSLALIMAPIAIGLSS